MRLIMRQKRQQQAQDSRHDELCRFIGDAMRQGAVFLPNANASHL
jgi:hypothetical protein